MKIPNLTIPLSIGVIALSILLGSLMYANALQQEMNHNLLVKNKDNLIRLVKLVPLNEKDQYQFQLNFTEWQLQMERTVR